MSLPSHGTIVKDGVYVGVGMCNIGWFFTTAGLHRCITEVMDGAMSEVGDPSKCWIEWYPWYFGSEVELQAFDYVVVYNYKFDRDLVMGILKQDVTASDLEQHINDNGGLEAFRFNGHNEVVAATAELRGPQP